MIKMTAMTGRPVPLRGDDIDTDRIIPARFMKCLTFDGLGKYAFYDERYDGEGRIKDHPLNDKRYEGASILISERNFGCGSSREHAPWALYHAGIRAVIAQSYAEIFAGNCSSLGMPALIMSPGDCETLLVSAEENPRELLEIDLKAKTVTLNGKAYPFTMPETYRLALIEGQWDTTALLLSNLDEVKERNSSLPGFT